MFKTDIVDTPFTTEAANSFFGNITGAKYRNDISFLATLRALLAPRIKEEGGVFLQFGRSRYEKSQLEAAGVEASINAMCSSIIAPPSGPEGVIYIHSLDGNAEANDLAFQLLQKGFVDYLEKQWGASRFTALEKITAFYQKAFRVLCFINEERKSVAVFVDRLDNKKLHYLQCSILAMMPWYFDKEVGITAQEMELIKSLRENKPDSYIAALEKMAKQYDFKTEKIKKLLNGFDTKIDRLTLDRLKAKIKDYDDDINIHHRQISDLLKAKDDTMIRVMGLSCRINEKGDNDSEIMQYFLCNKSLYLNNVGDDYIEFSVKSPITYFDPDLAESVIENERSCVYNHVDHSEMGDIKRLLRELFLSEDPRLHIIACAAYRLDLHRSIQAIGNYRFDADFSDAIPNMHIQLYRCLGNYEKAINELMCVANYVGGIEQCVASCKSLNFGDLVVLTDFFECLFKGRHGNNRCIELPDGSVVDYKGAIQWLNENEQVEEA